jgi:hypothetical protein
MSEKPVVIRAAEGIANTGGRAIFQGKDEMPMHEAIHVASLSNWRLVSVEAPESDSVWLHFDETTDGAVEALVAYIEKGVIVNIESHPPMNIELRTILLGMSESEMTFLLDKLGWKKVGMANGLVFYTRDIVL